MFVIVEFAEAAGSGLAVVHDTWFTPRKREVFWPPIKDSNIYHKLLKKGEVPDDETWKLYPVERFFYETDNFDKALRKLKLAERTSDLETTDLDDNRRHQKPRRRLYSSSEEEDEPSQYERPPKILRPLLSSVADIDGDSTLTPRSFRSLEASPTVSKEVINNNTSLIASTVDRTRLVTSSFLPSTAPISQTQLEQTGFQRKVIELLITIRDQNSEILSNLKGQPCRSTADTLENLPVSLPLKSQDEIDIIEAHLQDQNHLSELSSYLASLGGRDISSRTNRILKHLFVDQIAANYSFCGKRLQKRAFIDLRLKTCVLRAVKTSTPEATDKQTEDCIKVWLKHAPQRLKSNQHQQQ